MLPASRKTLSEFHRNVLNPKIITQYLTKQYDALQRHSNLRVLPTVTAKLFLGRLMKSRDFATSVRLLLDYELDEAVLLATHVLESMDIDEREFCLFCVHEHLTQVNQSGLARQVLTELGVVSGRLDAFERLVMVHRHLKQCDAADLADMQELCLLLGTRMRFGERGRLDPMSVLALMKRALALEQFAFAEDLCRHNWPATDAMKIFLRGKPEEFLVAIAEKQGEDSRETSSQEQTEQGDKSTIWIWILRRIRKQEHIRMLADHVPKYQATRSAMALASAKWSGTLDISLSLAIDASIQDLPMLLFDWTDHLAKMADGDVKDQVFSRVVKSLEGANSNEFSDVITNYLRLVNQATAGKLHKFPSRKLLILLRIVDACPVLLDSQAAQMITKQFYRRNAEETMTYVKCEKTTFPAISELLKHHLRQLRLYDRAAFPRRSAETRSEPTNDVGQDLHEDTSEQINLPTPSTGTTVSATDDVTSIPRIHPSIFAGTVNFLCLDMRNTDGKCKQHQLDETFDHILRNLLMLSSAGPALDFLKHTRTAYNLPPELGTHTIRALSHEPRNAKHIFALLRAYPTGIMTYDTFARYISRISSTSPVGAMAMFQLLLEKGLKPRRRLLQNLMLGISENTDISEMRAFRYLARVLKVAGLVGLAIDRVFLAGLLRVVLVRQGLGAATARLSWILKLSARVARQERTKTGRHEDLVDVLRKWQVHEQRSGGAGNKRPKRLREVIESMSARRTVIGRKRQKQHRRALRAAESKV